MEFIYILKLIKHKKWLFFSVLILFLVIGTAFYFLQKNSYEASLLFYVKRKIETPSEKYYGYDGYYASQVGKEYSDTVVGFFESLDVIKRAGQITNTISTDNDTLQTVQKHLTVTKEAPQLVRISINDSNKDKSKEMIKAIGQAGVERAYLLNQTGDPNLSVDVVDSEPLVFTKKINIFIIEGISFITGLVFSILTLLLRDLFKRI